MRHNERGSVRVRVTMDLTAWIGGSMATFVLVHGAFGGAHEFRLVRRKLMQAGHDPYTPSLTGIGERVHLSGAEVCLRTHVEDVTNLVEYWDLRDIVLLGFSYGGMVVTGTLEHIADRVAHLVYLDAMVPKNGESLDGLVGRSRSTALGTPWLMDPLPRTPSPYDDPVEEAFNAPRRTPQPIKTFADAVVLDRPLEDYPFTRTFIRATGEAREPTHPSQRFSDHARTSPQWRYHEIDSNHIIPSNRPNELVAILLELVR